MAAEGVTRGVILYLVLERNFFTEVQDYWLLAVLSAYCIARVGPGVLCAAHVTAVEIEEPVDVELLLRIWPWRRTCRDGLAGKWTRADPS